MSGACHVGVFPTGCIYCRRQKAHRDAGKMQLDQVIRDGLVFDGTGATPIKADVGVAAGRIAEIGRIKDRGRDEIDAAGLSVAPGFIDIHSHSDFTLLVDQRAVSAIHQGVTTDVIGNCGHGCFLISDPILARQSICGVTDSTELTWRDASGYFEQLDAAQPAVNVCSLVPNGRLRLATVGLADRPAAPEELRDMVSHLEAALEQGAWGLSTGLEYAIEMGATDEEITVLCKSVARAGGLYATHTRRRDKGASDAVGEAIRTAARTGVRLQVSHLLPRSSERRAVHRDGGECPRKRNRRCSRHAYSPVRDTYLHAALPAWAKEGGSEKTIGRLRDREMRAEMMRHESILSAGGDWQRILLLDNDSWPQCSWRSVHDIAVERQQSPLDTVYDLLLGAEKFADLIVILRCYTEEQATRRVRPSALHAGIGRNHPCPRWPPFEIRIPRRIQLGCLVLPVHGAGMEYSHARRCHPSSHRVAGKDARHKRPGDTAHWGACGYRHMRRGPLRRRGRRLFTQPVSDQRRACVGQRCRHAQTRKVDRKARRRRAVSSVNGLRLFAMEILVAKSPTGFRSVRLLESD